jgi:hypothetical protein
MPTRLCLLRRSRRVVAALVVFWALAVGAQTSGESAGKVTAVIRDTTVARGAAKKATSIEAVSGTPLIWQDMVQTRKTGRVRIQLNDQSVLSLGHDSKLRIQKHDARSQQTALQLNYGRIRCEVAKITRSGGNFELRTPSSVAGVIGTDFGADASIPGQTRYVCISGTVRIYTLDRQHWVDCGPGMTVTINDGDVPSTPAAATPFQLERWQHVTQPGDPRYAETLERAPDMSDRAPTDGSNVPQSTAAQWHGMNISGTVRVRAEVWNWFEDGGANNSYTFGHSILRLDIGQRRRTFDWQIELAQPSVFSAPDNAIAPLPQGQLGLGGAYYGANGARRNAAFVFPAKAFLRFRGLGGKDANQLTIGRFTFIDGSEVTPRNPTLAWLKEKRVDHRLLGDFNFAVTGRSADGAILSLNVNRANLTFAAGRPTRGVYQVDGLGELDVNWQYGSLTVPVLTARNAGELRIFGAGYQDLRAVDKTDNRPLALRPAGDRLQNINIGTFGFDYIHALHTVRAGIFDWMLWAVGQTGSWGTHEHRAGALAAEMGWQPPVAWRPWLRAAYYVGSGDGDPTDDRHHTFFPLLPTPRVYARFPFYNEQNNTDVSATLLLRPTSSISIRSDVHSLWLTSRKDLWYLGGGAFQPHTFGYQGRPGGGLRGLANTWDASADVSLSRHWAINFYYAHAWTKSAIRSVYPNGSGADFGYTELLFRF